ncbi:hypothetical protein [Chryseobacterium luquanense]|uniref:UDP-N-acetylglucosamine kinase n=1 Tax=Chryseobacterium luquanense TaxID=2983766 RepID=A0ABT3XYG5_9FLAO|nr:hypothetical protein [Chryseobacterium luquanense]MCX8530915.1 hypothetical protein [Chryseobacterium luquanense]
MTKRLRIFCGPNGSGKSTLFSEFIKNKFNPGLFVNSDNIESEISEKKFLDLSSFNLDLTQTDLDSFLTEPNSITLIEKAKTKGFSLEIKISENVILDISKNKNSYSAALISSFIRKYLMLDNRSFSFESVMSHPSKLYELKLAKELDYKTYLYFVCIDDPDVNVSRVNNRVVKGGHAVPDSSIKERYIKTLENLYPAMQLVDKAYLFDNSDQMNMIAEMENQIITLHVDEDHIPNWFLKYLINRE